MRILIAGSSGFLGSHLTTALRGSGHDVTRLVRRAPETGEARWDPDRGELDESALRSADVVVNLAGSPTAGNPHSRKWADALLSSRVTTTAVLAEAIAAQDTKPAFLVGNGISYYGDHGDEPLTEAADSRGDAFLTVVTRAWEAAAQPAVDAGARVCILRTAPVLDAASAPLKQLSRLFRTGLGGRIGSGQQYFPVISLRDWIGAVVFLAEHDVDGPFNLCCPSVPTNAAFTKTLGELLHRPTLAPVPQIVVKQAAGRMAPEVLGSLRTVPQALLDAGFRFEDPEIGAVLRAGLSRARRLAP